MGSRETHLPLSGQWRGQERASHPTANQRAGRGLRETRRGGESGTEVREQRWWGRARWRQLDVRFGDKVGQAMAVSTNHHLFHTCSRNGDC